MGLKFSVKQREDDYFTTPISISEDALNLVQQVTESGYGLKNQLKESEEIWRNIYLQVEENYDKNFDKETFNRLYDSLSIYLESNQKKEGEELKKQIFDCYGEYQNQTLYCAPVVKNFYVWLRKTAKDKVNNNN